MAFIDNIRKKTYEEKMHIIWTVAGVTALFLIALWMVTAQYSKRAEKDMTLFQTISRGIQDFKESIKK